MDKPGGVLRVHTNWATFATGAHVCGGQDCSGPQHPLVCVRDGARHGFTHTSLDGTQRLVMSHWGVGDFSATPPKHLIN